MTVDQEKINKVHQLYSELDQLKEVASELLRTAQDRFQDNEVEIERGGNLIKVREKDLWEEIFQLGRKCQAGEVLNAQHPEVFEAYDKEAEKALELKQYLIAEFGIDYQKIKVSDIFKLVEAVVDYKLSQPKS